MLVWCGTGLRNVNRHPRLGGDGYTSAGAVMTGVTVNHQAPSLPRGSGLLTVPRPRASQGASAADMLMVSFF